MRKAAHWLVFDEPGVRRDAPAAAVDELEALLLPPRSTYGKEHVRDVIVRV